MLLLPLACSTPPDPVARPPAPSPAAGLWASGWFSNEVVRQDPDTGEILDRWDVPGAQALVPQGDRVLAVAEGEGRIVALEPGGGLEPFAEGLAAPTGFTALPGGGYAVASFTEGRVLAVSDDGVVGEVLAEGLGGPDAGLSVDARGRMWVPCYEDHEVVVFDGPEVVLRLEVTRPRVIRHAPDGTAWITSWAPGAVRRFSPEGVDLGDFVARSGATGLFLDGDVVWLASDQTGAVQALDAATGDVVGRLNPRLDGITFVQRVGGS